MQSCYKKPVTSEEWKGDGIILVPDTTLVAALRASGAWRASDAVGLVRFISGGEVTLFAAVTSLMIIETNCP